MTGYRPGMYWQLTWRYIGPAMMGVLLTSSVYQMVSTPPTYSAWDAKEVSFSVLALLCGFSIWFSSPFTHRARRKNCHTRIGSWLLQLQ